MSGRRSQRRANAAGASLLVLLLTAGAALAAPGLEQQAQRVRELLAEWRPQDAERALAPLLRIAPDDPAVQRAAAELRFRQGRYDDARRLLDRLLATPAGRGSASVKRLAALVQSTAETVKGYRQEKPPGGHFVFRTSGRDRYLVPFASETLEAVRERLQKDLGYVPPAPILVEIYPRPADLARVSPLTEQDIERSGTIALCKYQRLMIVSPRALLRGYGWRDTLAHEYTHLVVSRLSHNRVPIWLHEGLAKLFEARWRLPPAANAPLTPIQRHLLASALSKGTLIPWAKMHPSMAKLPNQRATALAFAEVQTALAFVTSRVGIDGLRRLIAALRAGQDDWSALRSVTKLSRAAFTKGWKQYLRGLKLERKAGLELEPLVFGKARSKEQRIAKIRLEKARRYFRLADLLRQRNLLHAAALEYEKARSLGGARDSFVANALARTYLQLKLPERAIDVLKPVIEYYPEIAGVQATLGAAYLAAAQRKEAAAHLEVALRINPFNPQIHCDLAQALPAGPAASRHVKLCKELR